jgi:hypothetical protein
MVPVPLAVIRLVKETYYCRATVPAPWHPAPAPSPAGPQIQLEGFRENQAG